MMLTFLDEAIMIPTSLAAYGAMTLLGVVSSVATVALVIGGFAAASPLALTAALPFAGLAALGFYRAKQIA
jgi:hypothetical protein